jgi:hypothetical protein
MPTGSSGLELVGVEATVQNLDKFFTDLDKMHTGVSKFGEDATKAGKGAEGLGKGLGGAGEGASKASGLMSLLGGQMGSIGKLMSTLGVNTGKAGQTMASLGGQLTGVVGSSGQLATVLGGAGGLTVALGAVAIGVAAVVAGIAALTAGTIFAAKTITELAVAAAGLDGISAAFASTVARTGVALGDLRTAAAGTIADFELMRLTNFALAGTGEQLGKEFGENLPKLLEVARTVAKATGEDINFMFDSIVRGIKRGQPLILDNALLMISAEEANQKYAESIGVTADQLTKEQQQLAVLNLTLEKGDQLIEQFGNTQRTAAENIAAMGAQTQNIKDTLGLVFQPALRAVTAAISDFVSKLSEAISEGGALRPVIINIGAAVSILADIMAKGINIATDFVTGFGTNLINGLMSIGKEAFRWGAEIITSLSLGIWEAAATVLTKAMQAVGNILSFWLAPGSPPRVAPDIDKWGTAAMTEYLEGFTEADFGILNNIQSVLKQALTGADFADISEKLVAAISGGGAIDPAIFDAISQKAGQFGNQIADLARKQFALADATDVATQAQLQYDEAIKGISDAQTEVSSLTQEYNRLLKAGASEEILEAQLEQINAAEANVALAEDQARASAKANDEAQAGVETAKEEAKLQDALVKELLEIAKAREKDAKVQKAQTKSQEKLAKVAAGVGGVGAPDIADIGAGIGAGIGALDIGEFDIAGKISEEVARMKEEMLGPGGMLEPYVIWWEEVQKIFDGLGNEFVILDGKIDTAIGNVRNVILGLPESFENLKASAIETWSIITNIISNKVEEIRNNVSNAIKSLAVKMGIDLDEMKARWFAIWEDVKLIASTIWERISTAISEKVTEIRTAVIEKIQEISDMLLPIWDAIINNFDLVWSAIVTIVSTKSQEVFDSVVAAITLVKDWLMEQPFFQIGVQIIQGLIDGVLSKAGELLTSITGVVENALGAVKSALGISSPSKVFARIGENIIAGLKGGTKGKDIKKHFEDIFKGALTNTRKLSEVIQEQLQVLSEKLIETTELVVSLVEDGIFRLESAVSSLSSVINNQAVGAFTSLSTALIATSGSMSIVSASISTLTGGLQGLSSPLSSVASSANSMASGFSAATNAASDLSGMSSLLIGSLGLLAAYIPGFVGDRFAGTGALGRLAAGFDTTRSAVNALIGRISYLITRLQDIVVPDELFGDTGGYGRGARSFQSQSVSAPAIVNQNINVNMGGVAISNQMDEVAFAEAVRQVVTDALR